MVQRLACHPPSRTRRRDAAPQVPWEALYVHIRQRSEPPETSAFHVSMLSLSSWPTDFAPLLSDSSVLFKWSSSVPCAAHQRIFRTVHNMTLLFQIEADTDFPPLT